MLTIKRHINQLMSSNCYVISDTQSQACLIIDPGSEKSEDIIKYIEQNKLTPEYIILTHEHSDHTWGVNSLLNKYPELKVIATQVCKEALPNASQAYFRFYYSDPEYAYYVNRVDITVEELDCHMNWCGEKIEFILTPGHSNGSMCVKIGDNLFSGDTVMLTKPYVNKRDGSVELYKNSVELLKNTISDNVLVYPGHGGRFYFKKFVQNR